MQDTGLSLNVGDTYPGENFEGSILMMTSMGISLLCAYSGMTETHIADFMDLSGYGVYEDAYPLVIWEFGHRWIVASPFDPTAEKQKRPEELDLFLNQKNNVIQRVLLDENNTVLSVVRSGLSWGFLDHIQGAWRNPGDNWQGYADWIERLLAEKPIEAVWAEARQYGHGARRG